MKASRTSLAALLLLLAAALAWPAGASAGKLERKTVNGRTHYVYTGDKRILTDHYEGLKRYVDYLTTKADKGIVSIGLGDWAPWKTS